ncbi:MAG: hypothetical protein AVO33_05295 [delta proteobacterium ML8_F1]|nr:MAG: hypothetical protein AVO33_05295 [delta proteobacterium ML8_F1]
MKYLKIFPHLDYQRRLTGIFTLTGLVKIVWIHLVIGINPWLFIPVTLLNLINLLVLSLLLSCRRQAIHLWRLFALQVIFTLLVIGDLMYFSHFYTLLPAHSILQMGQLGPVTQSIVALFRPSYGLLFLDLVLLLYLLLRKKETLIPGIFLFNHKRLPLYGVFFLLISFTLPQFFGIAGHYTPQNLGILHYHLYDLVTLALPQNGDEELVDQAMDSLTEEQQFDKYSGLLEGKNVIVIQAESLQAFVIESEIGGQPITPSLDKLITKDSFTFDSFFEQVGWGNTSDAEFVSHNGYYPALKSFSYKAYENNHFRTLPQELQNAGYQTLAFHGNEGSFWNRKTIYPKQGIETFYSSEELVMDEIIGIGLSDRSLFRQAIPILEATERPFYAFFVTLTSHHPYTLPENHQHLELPDYLIDTAVGNYLQSIRYLDTSIDAFLNDLKEAGLYKDTAIVIYGDHQGLDHRDPGVKEQMHQLLGRPYLEEDMFNVPLIIHVPGMDESERIATAGGQIDFYPTMRNLMGWEPQPDRMIGQDLINATEGFVAKQVHVARGSFINDKISFFFSPDGIFENSTARNRRTMEKISTDVCREGYERALGEIMLSEYILENDLVPMVTEHGLAYIHEMMRGNLP